MNSLMQLQRDLAYGQKVPIGYRMAWYEPRRRVGVYWPAPLHWILRVTREARYRLSLAIQAPTIERAEELEMQRLDRERQRLSEEYGRGYVSGWRECFQTCLATIEEEMSHGSRLWDADVHLTVGGLAGPKN